MKKLLCILLLGVFAGRAVAQSPETAPLPAKFEGIENGIIVDHFPSPVWASTDPDEPGTYFWKHATSFISPTENIKIIEGGAYIFYNDQWNLRVEMNAKEISKLFDIPKTGLKAGEPYTFVKNWRRDSRLVGGWAMWYLIGETAEGKRVFGIGKLDTVGTLYDSEATF